MEAGRKKFIALFALIGLLFVLWLFLGGMFRKRPGEKGALEIKPFSPVIEMVSLTVRVNGAKRLEVGKDDPVFVTALVLNPKNGKDIRASVLNNIKPQFKRLDGGGKLHIMLSELKPFPAVLKPDSAAKRAWKIEDMLDVGEYKISLTLTKELKDAISPIPYKVYSAALRIGASQIAPQLQRFWERRMLELKGNLQTSLRGVEEEIKQNPQLPVYVMEKVDLLTKLQKANEAKESLFFIEEKLHRMSKDNAKNACWIPFRLENL